MRLGRILRITALALWLTAVPWYWWHAVPPAPAHVISLHGRSHRWTPGLSDTIVLSHSGPGEGRNTGPRGERRPPSFGPLQFYDPATGGQLREVLTADDEILWVDFTPRPFAIVHTGDVVRSVDLSDPEKSIELEDVDPNSKFAFAGGDGIITTNGGRTGPFDLTTGDRIVRPNRHTGAQEYAFAYSQDEQRYVTSNGQQLLVFDTATDNEICRVPLAAVGRRPALTRFSPDGHDLMVLEDVKPPQRCLTIWNIETGQKQSTQPSALIPRGPLSRHGSWVINNENPTSLVALLVEKLPASITKRLQRSTFFWNLMMRTGAQQSHLIVLTDTFSGQPLGRYQIPSTAEWLLVADDRRGAAAFGDHNAIHCYRVPADRNWLWLLKWGVGPVVAAWSLLFLFRKWRQRRRLAAAVVTPVT
jgi:hypothetical protein